MVDSADGENELAPFKNIMNEMYARDRFVGYLDLPEADPVTENTRKGVVVSYLSKALPA